MRRAPAPSLRGLLVALALGGGLMAPTLAKNRVSSEPPVAIVQTCDWDRPGHNPFMGDVVAAVDRYQDIPVDVRERLKARMVKRAYDDVVTIRRDTIRGKARYGTTIRDMHFGSHQVCRSVTRSAWSAQMQERGLVYCEGGDCVLVPTVCRNVSRIARAEVADERAEGDVPPFDVVPIFDVPMAAAGAAPVPPEADLPSGLPLLDSQPAFASPFSAGGGSFAAGAIGGSGGSGPTSGPSGARLSESPGAGTAPVVSDSQLSAGVAAVPEPETWCLLLAGLGVLGAVSRRRLKRST